MAQMKMPSEPKMYATQYRTLLGVDFQKDVTDVDKNHSPNMVNMISDLGGNPIKRPGYRVFEEDKTVSTYPNDRFIYFISIMDKLYGIKKHSGENKSEIIVIEVEFADFKVKEKKVVRAIELDTGNNPNATTDIYIRKIFSYKNYMYILTHNAYIRVNVLSGEYILSGVGKHMMSQGDVPGMSAPTTSEIIPLTTFSITNPENGTGGESLYGKNLLSIYQMCSYVLSNPNDGSQQTQTKFKIPNYAKITDYVKVEVMDSNGSWVETTDFTLDEGETEYGYWADTYYRNGKIYTSGYTMLQYKIHEPIVTFKNPPSWSPVTGQDSVRITFVPFSKEIEEEHNVVHDYDICRGVYNSKLIELIESEVFTVFNTRLFVGVDNKAYYSEPSRMLMVPDNYWLEVDHNIMSFARLNSNLSIITDGTGANTIYVASESTETVNTTTGETETRYSIKPSNSGIGAINGNCTGTLNDEPLFLSKDGVYGVLTNWLSDKYAVNRSARINRKLCKEPDLKNAVGITWNGYYYIAINGKMYVLDSRHKDSVRRNNTSYECYFFDSMPSIKEMYVVDDVMLFSDGDFIYRWNDDLSEYYKYYDDAHMVEVVSVLFNSSESNKAPEDNWDTRENVNKRAITNKTVYWTKIVYSGKEDEIIPRMIDEKEEPTIGTVTWTGTPVCCKWCSTFDDDGSPQKLKTLNKKGTMLTVAPYAKSSVELTLIKDGNDVQHLGIYETNLLSFERIDLTKFSFKSNAVVSDVFPKKKIKKYKRLQFVLENKRAEPFGITNIVKTYTIGNYAKR